MTNPENKPSAHRQGWDAAIEAAASSILPEEGNAGPPQDHTDELLDEQCRRHIAIIRNLPYPGDE